jgi:predicted acylesterase/phospholipase RssA
VSPECDVVLEGGVTSAVTYAGLLARLSQTYNLRYLAGTSAGAVAAAAGAIAERSRRTTGNQDAFEVIGRLPQDLGATDPQGRTNLFKLFQPQPATRPGYQVIIAALSGTGANRWARGVLSVLWAAVRAFPLAALIGAVPGLWFAAGALGTRFSAGAGWASGVTFGLGLLLAVVLATCAALAWGLWRTGRAMAQNNLGLCSGMPPAGSDAVALTPMLHALYNQLAGRKATDPPVVFGDLWGAGAERGGPREIDLQVITTALNLKRPLRLPNDPGVDPLHSFFYDPLEWAALFPASVLEWLRTHRRDGGALRVRSPAGRALVPFPVPKDWPVVMAVRLSLSFPGLLSAVPMYGSDQWREIQAGGHQPENADFVADRVYFSDGGITSNCPIHLFDAALPARPTFGVTLWRIDQAGGDGRGLRPEIWMYGDRLSPDLSARPFHQRFPLAGVLGFITAIIGTALDWHDSLQRVLPGYRERIVHIGLPPSEGGLNLGMTARTIIDLGKAGEDAADRLVQQFEGSSTEGRFNGWELHRWVRMRSTLAATRQHLLRLSEQMRAGTPAYRDLPQQVPQPLPRFAAAAAAEQAALLMDGVGELMAEVEVASPNLTENVPEPAPTLRMSSPW